MILCHNVCSGNYSAESVSDFIMLNIPSPHNNLYAFALAEGLGGIMARCITAPLEKIKILLQTQ